MVNAFRRQIRWMAFGSEGNPLRQYHPFRPFIHWYNTYQMNRYISPKVDARFDMYRNASTSNDKSSSIVRDKSIMDLASIAYLKQNPNANSSGGIDPVFKDMAINQMKSFLFAGQDTTSSTICYVLYLLSIYPNVLSRVRAEHNDVFGQDLFQVANKISEDPYLLNKLPYTTATIKESMRLFPAASTTRRGEPSFTITDPRNGLHYPADESMLIWLVSHACHHDPAFWPRANEFLPERWLAKEGEELCPKQRAWRPFELGPRACVGKELSFLELKVLLALVARRFELETAYKELDAAEEELNIEVNLRKKVRMAAVKTVDGERAYQVGKGEPSTFLPCRVREVVSK